MEQNPSIKTSQTVRFREVTAEIQTVVLNGIVCLRLQDVQRRFPSASALCIDDIQLPFLYDEDGIDLKPLRIEACPNKVVEALESIGQHNDTLGDRLDRISADMQEVRKTNEIILANTQETLLRLKHVMTQMYELHEFTTPRYFFILPAKHHDWKPANDVKNLFLQHLKLYFLCECSDEPDKLHIAAHDGYSIKKPTEFITKYGPYLRTTLTVARAVVTVGAMAIPQLAVVSTSLSNALVPVMDQLNEVNLTGQLDKVESLLDRFDSQISRVDTSKIDTGKSHRVPIQGAQLRELESYLKMVDSQNSLGNLYRTVTDDGHVRWVCLQHYNSIGYNRKLADYIRQFEAFGGKFNEETNSAFVNNSLLTTKNIDMLCDALTKGFNVLSLTFEKCPFNEKDLDKLLEIVVNRSSVRCLVFSRVRINVSQWLGVTKSEYICGCISIHINNRILKVQFFERFQDGDMKLLVRLLSQNKICRAFYILGGHFSQQGKNLHRCLQINQESVTLIMNYLNNVEFLCDVLNGKSSLHHLKLSFWLSSPSILSRFCEALKKNSTLVELSIMDHYCCDDEDFTIQLLTALHGHKSIQSLSFHVYNVQPSSRKETCLIDTLRHHSFISRLHISESTISKTFIQALIHASQKIKILSHLEFYGCQIDSNDVLSLESLHASENLAHLTISNEQYWILTLAERRRQFQLETAQYQNQRIEEIIQQHKNHSEVNLYKEDLADRDILMVIRKAMDDKQCVGLYLGSNKITSIGVSILADALNNSKTLEKLGLYDNQVCDDGIYFLAKTLSVNNTNLKKLDLGKNQITDEGVKHLAQMLKTNKTLTLLYLTHNEITDEGVSILANAIQNYNTTIELLHLSENKLITDLCVDHFLPMIKDNQSLKDFRICDCNLTEQGKERLKISPQSKDSIKIWV